VNPRFRIPVSDSSRASASIRIFVCRYFAISRDHSGTRLLQDDDDHLYSRRARACARATEYSECLILSWHSPRRSLYYALCESVERQSPSTTSFLNLTPRPIRVQPVPISAGRQRGTRISKLLTVSFDLIARGLIASGATPFSLINSI